MTVSRTSLSRTSLLMLTVCGGFVLAAAPRASAQDLYVSDFDSSQILEYTQAGTLARTFSANGLFVSPDGLLLAGGSLYVSAQDSTTGNGSIYQYNLSNPTAAPTLFASDPGGVLSGLAFSGGNLYAADSQNGKIVVFNGQTGTQTGSFGSGGSNPLVSPIGLAFENGSLYVADSGADDVLKYNDSGTSHSVFVATGSGGLQSPGDITFDTSGNLLVASGQGASNGGSLDRFSASGSPDPAVGNAGAVFASDPGLLNPYGVAISPMGAVFVGDRNSNNSNGSGGGGHFDEFNADGTFAESFAFNGGNGNPYGLAFGPASGPAAVPEVSTQISFGLLLALGLCAVRRRRHVKCAI